MLKMTIYLVMMLWMTSLLDKKIDRGKKTSYFISIIFICSLEDFLAIEKAKIKVLIVEDEAMVREILRDYLEDEGYQVKVVESAEIGLEILNTNEFHIVIVDIRLSNMDGNTFIIKAKAKIKDLQFLIHTGSTDYVIPSELVKIGITSEHLFNKPQKDMSVISKAIVKCLENFKE